VEERSYRINARHWAYIAAKLLRRGDSLRALLALLARGLRDGLRVNRAALRALPDIVTGFVHGLRRRQPLRNAELSRVYRTDFESFADPWSFARPPGELLRAYPREILGPDEPPRSDRFDEFFERRARYYPEHAATLDF
jgi:hypothetical protein